MPRAQSINHSLVAEDGQMDMRAWACGQTAGLTTRER